MSEHLHLRFGEVEFEATPDNTTLFTFLGRSAIRGVQMDHSRINHIFFQTGEQDEDTLSGSYVFRTDKNEQTFDTIVNHIVEHDYPMMLNRRDVPECDINAYFNMLEQKAIEEAGDLGDFLPEDWS